MKKLVLLVLTFMLCVCILQIYYQQDYTNENTTENMINQKKYTFIAIICEDRGKKKMSINHTIFRELNVMLKSAAMLTRRNLRFIILTDIENIQNNIEAIISMWPKYYRGRLMLNYQKPAYPPGLEQMTYLINKPYSSVRIFSHDMFPDLDAAIYLDTDVIFLRSPEELWEEFNNFNDIQLAAMPASTVYLNKRHTKIPDYPPGGISTNLLMMNLTRIRRLRQYNLSTPVEGSWNSAMLNIYTTYKKQLKLAEQTMVNIFFFQNPGLLYPLGCWWNFHFGWCRKSNVDFCLPHMENRGVSSLHGAANTFIRREEEKINVVFNAFENHILGSPIKKLLTSLNQSLSDSLKTPSSDCDRLKNIDDILLMELKNYV